VETLTQTLSQLRYSLNSSRTPLSHGLSFGLPLRHAVVAYFLPSPSSSMRKMLPTLLTQSTRVRARVRDPDLLV